MSSYKDKTISYYDKHASRYAQNVDSHYSTEQISSFLSMLPEKAKVLDVGSGSGRDVYVMHKAGINALGMDLSEGMLSYSRQKYPNLEFVKGDMEHIPFDDKEFDGLWVHGTLLHAETNESVQNSLAEFNRVLKPNGILHILVKKQKDSQPVKVFTDKESGESRLYRFFQEEELKIILGKAGFHTIISETYEENERNPKGRHDVTWIHSLSKKVTTST